MRKLILALVASLSLSACGGPNVTSDQEQRAGQAVLFTAIAGGICFAAKIC